MNLQEFSVKLSTINSKSALKASICDFINTHDKQVDKKDIKNYIKSLTDDKFTSFGNNLGYCRNYCIEEKENEENKIETEYLVKIDESAKLLETLSQVYQEINLERENIKKSSNEAAAIAQQRDVLKEINIQIKNFKSDIENAKSDIKRANDSFNDKIFSLLINTVAILGIFVAIAFAGFGVMSIFPEISISYAMESRLALIKTTFFLMLTALLVYNLLLLLCYFIFKLTQAFGIKQDNKFSFLGAINLKPFYWIDGIVLILTIISFIVSLYNI